MKNQAPALVQFGKYKGQPLAVLAQDPSYCDWLTQDEEHWRDIEGCEGFYQVSDRGRVRSLDRLVSSGGTMRLRRTKVLKARLNGAGYFHVALSRNGHTQTTLVSRLVAVAFIPNPENKPEVNHKDGVKTHNDVGNLEWSTKSENHQHAHRAGLKHSNLKLPYRGTLNGNSKLTEEDVLSIRLCLAAGMLGKDIARRTGMSASTISQIKHRETWGFLPENAPDHGEAQA
jgi:hypothetical protein